MPVTEIRVADKTIKRTLKSTPGCTAKRYDVTGTVVFDVLFSAVEDRWSPIAVLDTPGLPRVGDRYTERGIPYRDVYFESADAKPDGVRNGKWVWQVSYSLKGDSFEAESSISEEPEQQIISISLGTESDPYSVPRDQDGQWCLNSSGEFFADPLVVEYGIATFTFSRREYDNPYTKALGYWGKVNSDRTWGVFEPGFLKVTKILPSLSYTSKQAFWTVNYELQYKARGWWDERADAGYWTSDGRILNADGSPADSPQLLDGHGQLLAQGASPVFKRFRTFQWGNLNELGLLSPFTEINQDF